MFLAEGCIVKAYGSLSTGGGMKVKHPLATLSVVLGERMQLASRRIFCELFEAL